MNASHTLEHLSENLWLKYFQTVEEMVSLKIVYIVLMLIIFFAGMVGNMVTCVVIYYDRSMHNVTNYYLFNLAVSDLVALLTILLEVAYYSGKIPIPTDVLGNAVCKMETFMLGVLWNNSILIITALAVERYVAVVHPLAVKRRRVRRRVARVMAAAWSVAVLETLPDVFFVKMLYTRFGPVCFVTLSWYNQVLSAAAAFCNFLVPLAIMLYVYIVIALTVNASYHTTDEDNIFNQLNYKKKINKLIMALTLSFLACWLPYFSLRVVYALGDPRMLIGLAQHWQVWYVVVSLGAWFSSMLNPLLFSLMSTKFRKALKVTADWHLC
ncbi:neuromedin-U receptor 2 isoform X2 [Amyelois transitella]|uniref:neuromedin-U receptor 2 isoform X2 n=1 Tax=Amyelois transitella TaxID=680683 RepID=UPI00067D7665|nr:neuromedin-U receptor 2 isoform X2 [Amyelois transitella]